MKQFNLIIKNVFVPTFVGVFFLWLSFVYGQCNVYTQCYTNWCNDASSYSWFDNSSSAYSNCIGDSTCSNYLDWPNSYSSEPWVHVSSNINEVWSAMGISEPSPWCDAGSPECNNNSISVSTLQNKLNSIGCFKQHNEQRGEDTYCMLWYDTLYDMTHCCIWEWETLPNMTTGNPTCDDWSLETNDFWQQCCVEEEEISCDNAPTIIVDWWLLFTEYDKVVTISYNNNQDPNNEFKFTELDIQINWGTTTDLEVRDKEITFYLVPNEGVNTITITVPEWKWKIWDNNCSGATEVLNRDTNCPNWFQNQSGTCCMFKADWESCDNKDALQGLKTWIDFSWIWDNDCLFEEADNQVYYSFCPGCDTPPINWWCGYYSTWHGLNWECCEECWSNQKVENNQCVCGLTWCTDPWETLIDCECVCDPSVACCGIKLNTVVPFIWDCIEMTSQNSTQWARPNSSYINQLNAFPFLMMGLSKILVTVILIFSFLVVIIAGLMMVTWVTNEGNYKKWMDMIKNVVVALILLWSSWLILRLINPSFFWG